MTSKQLVRQKAFHETNQDIWLLRQCAFDPRASSKDVAEQIRRVKRQKIMATEEIYADRLKSVLDEIDHCLSNLQENLYKAMALETQKSVDRKVLALRRLRQHQLVFPEVLEAGLSA